MPRNWQTEDGVEPVSDSMMEQFGNWQNFNMVTGCEATYSGTDLTVSIDAGQVHGNGTLYQIPSGTVTLVPDATYPRWAWITQFTSGPAIRHGTAAANPTVPNISAFTPNSVVEIALVLIEPNQTIAANCAYKFDKRMFGPRVVVVSSGGSGGTSAILNADTSATYGIHTAIPDLAVPVGANSIYTFRALIHYTMPTTGDYQWKIAASPGSDLSLMYQEFDNGGTGIVNAIEGSVVTGSANGFGSATPGVLAIEGSLITRSDAGTLQFYAGGTTTGGYTKAKSRIEVF